MGHPARLHWMPVTKAKAPASGACSPAAPIRRAPSPSPPTPGVHLGSSLCVLSNEDTMALVSVAASSAAYDTPIFEAKAASCVLPALDQVAMLGCNDGSLSVAASSAAQATPTLEEPVASLHVDVATPIVVPATPIVVPAEPLEAFITGITRTLPSAILAAPFSDVLTPLTSKNKYLASQSELRRSSRLASKLAVLSREKAAQELLARRLGLLEPGEPYDEAAAKRYEALFDGSLSPMATRAIQGLVKAVNKMKKAKKLPTVVPLVAAIAN
ncbi:hypothetical protein ZWY2020_039083 [Hordeum vulgare]|nr:hypothetical protein ZWY2020_039083 [Hordeum vulgare]